MTDHDRPAARTDVRITGPEDAVTGVEDVLGHHVIAALAYAARRFDVMITVSVSPYATEEVRGVEPTPEPPTQPA